MTEEWVKGFRIVFPDGDSLDGAQFPSGRVILDGRAVGLLYVAVSLEDLLRDNDWENAKIEFEERGHE